jgi:nitroreductase
LTDDQQAAGEAPEVAVMAAMETQRAVRHMKSAPVPTEIVEKLIFAATRAPSGGNSQPWEFIAITDPAPRQHMGEIYRSASERLFRDAVVNSPEEATRRIYRDALHLSEHLGHAPLLIMVCVRVPEGRTFARQLPSVYPAVQNLLLAARALGLASVLTTMHKTREEEVKALLGIPDGIETVCLIPIGYPEQPDRAFRRITNRRPVREVLHWEHY